MFASIKRLMGSGAERGNEGETLAAWAKSEGHLFKNVRSKGGRAGYVVEDPSAGWRVEWGTSQRSYIKVQELRFRSETSLPPDVQILLTSKVVSRTLEAEVFSSFTNAMQTQVDNTLPDEMRWLAMHTKVALPESSVLSKRFVVLSNADEVARRWLSPQLLQVLEEAATSWWADTLTLVLTVNRGRLTMRMPGQPLQVAQLKAVSALFEHATDSLRAVASA